MGSMPPARILYSLTFIQSEQIRLGLRSMSKP